MYNDGRQQHNTQRKTTMTVNVNDTVTVNTTDGILNVVVTSASDKYGDFMGKDLNGSFVDLYNVDQIVKK